MWDFNLCRSSQLLVFHNRLAFSKYWPSGALTSLRTDWGLRTQAGAGGFGTGLRKPEQLKPGFSFGRKRPFFLQRPSSIRTQKQLLPVPVPSHTASWGEARTQGRVSCGSEFLGTYRALCDVGLQTGFAPLREVRFQRGI